VMEKFKNIDLHPDVVPNLEMGYIFEELIRKFNEALNENPGGHFTPREVIRLMVNLILAQDQEALKHNQSILLLPEGHMREETMTNFAYPINRVRTILAAWW
jgi:type I restriction-modification system DNA methylase subunit